MVVPVDSALEGLARKWVRSEDLDLRRDAVRALGHFENDENIALVRKMLDDPGFYISGASRIYDVRKAAYAVLQKWGVDAAEPIVEEPVTQKRREPEQESAEDDSPQSAPASNDTFPYLVILVVVVIVVSACVALLLLRRRNSP